jgi:Arc/MetJ-type ribon-helix-helix transcriptional regulator
MSSKTQAKKLGDLLRKARDEAPARPHRSAGVGQPALVIRSIALTPAADAALERLITGVSEKTGRKTSASAVVRALLRGAEQRDLVARVTSLIEAEVNTGEVVWGKVRAVR